MKNVLCLSGSSQFLNLLLAMLSCLSAAAQVNSGSDGSDGPFNPTQNTVIDMSLRPSGIYQYTSVNIPSGVTVTFTPNANNTPVVWLVQGSCTIEGTVSVAGQSLGQDVGFQSVGGKGGPGGFNGGSGGGETGNGLGPGGGTGAFFGGGYGVAGSHASLGSGASGAKTYGNSFILPLIGGSGGASCTVNTNQTTGGGGGGGAILIAATGTITVNGAINATGGDGNRMGGQIGGGGSGGAIRLVTNTIAGSGSLDARGNSGGLRGGDGRVRLDIFTNSFGGTRFGSTTQGFQPIIIPASGQGVQLVIQSIGGVSVAASPNGVLANPDVILPAQQQNPMNVVVGCSNLPMNTTITVTVRPANGADIVATGTNSSGTPTASTATIPVSMPRGGGILFAKCVSGVAGSASVSGDDYGKNIAQTGWTAHGERFAQMEIIAGIGSSQQVAYITESGKRYTLPVQ